MDKKVTFSPVYTLLKKNNDKIHIFIIILKKILDIILTFDYNKIKDMVCNRFQSY